MKKYRTILADPPWATGLTGLQQTRNFKPSKLIYPTMPIADIKALPIGDLAEEGCHLWLWVTNSHLRAGFDVMSAWGFKYLAPITCVKPSGLGNWFVHRTIHILFGYRGKCQFNLARWKPTVLFIPTPTKHSRKPEEGYQLIESISDAPRLELFARKKREGWDSVGLDIDGCDVMSTYLRMLRESLEQ